MTDRAELAGVVNTDRELWRESDDAFADSVHVTEGRGIGINVGGYVIVKTPLAWHQLVAAALSAGEGGAWSLPKFFREEEPSFGFEADTESMSPEQAAITLMRRLRREVNELRNPQPRKDGEANRPRTESISRLLGQHNSPPLADAEAAGVSEEGLRDQLISDLHAYIRSVPDDAAFGAIDLASVAMKTFRRLSPAANLLKAAKAALQAMGGLGQCCGNMECQSSPQDQDDACKEHFVRSILTQAIRSAEGDEG